MESQPTNDLIALSARSSSRGNPREVLKEKKNKRNNYFSRSSEESVSLEVSEETYLLASGPSDDDFVSERPLGQTAFDSISPAPRELSSRVFTAISAQHNHTAKGIKVSVTLQTAEDAELGLVKLLTAELKRWDRIRELKPYEHDTDFFAEFYKKSLEDIRTDTAPSVRSRVCVGRLHTRGRRSAWMADMIIVGWLSDLDTLERVLFYYGTEEYDIAMDMPLSPRQSDIYRSAGLWGQIKTAQVRPTLNSIQSQPFRP